MIRSGRSTHFYPDALRQALCEIAVGLPYQHGATSALARDFGKSRAVLNMVVHRLRKVDLPPDTPWQERYRAAMAKQRSGAPQNQQDGAAGGFSPACVCGPERAGAVSGHDSQGPSPLAAVASRDLDVSSLNLGARGESRAVAPAAGLAPPAPLERVGATPAAEFSEEEPYSPGLCWARQRLLAGIPLDKLLRTAGEQLTWRDRDQLRGVPV